MFKTDVTPATMGIEFELQPLHVFREHFEFRAIRHLSGLRSVDRVGVRTHIANCVDSLSSRGERARALAEVIRGSTSDCVKGFSEKNALRLYTLSVSVAHHRTEAV
jgi:hypothetical protein